MGIETDPTETVRCPACRRKVPAAGNLAKVGANALLSCPVCLTESEVSNVNRESFRWTLLPGRAPVLRPPAED